MGGTNWIDLAQGRDRWRAFVNADNFSVDLCCTRLT